MSTTTTPTTYYYVRPTDSLFVRGNLAFGDAGEHGGSLMPPPPSLFAGALRSALLGQDAEQLAAFVSTGRCTRPELDACLGSAEQPGHFRLTWLSLAGQLPSGPAPEAISPLPADLLVLGQDFAPLVPRGLPAGLQSAGELPLRATLAAAKQDKPKGGVYLHASGLQQHLQGQLPAVAAQVDSKHLYRRDPRLGIGLNAQAGTVEEGLIYTTEGFAFSPASDTAPARYASTGFLIGLQGVGDLLPQQGTLRLGGDGRSAQYQRVTFAPPRIDLKGAQRFRLLLQTPALFKLGWLPEGVTRQDDGSYRLRGPGYSARLACAAVGRREVVSGWDLYQWRPKPAQAAVPAGSVYWFDDFQGDARKLATWAENGLWPDDLDTLQQARRAEGYNCALLGAWI
jgi:CRISPR-associated protein Cmr3